MKCKFSANKTYEYGKQYFIKKIVQSQNLLFLETSENQGRIKDDYSYFTPFITENKFFMRLFLAAQKEKIIYRVKGIDTLDSLPTPSVRVKSKMWAPFSRLSKV